MIANCKCCHRPFWRYRRDFPPAGFCSLPCHENGPRAEQGKEDVPPPMPAVVLHDMRAHRLSAHRTNSILGWFDDCKACAELEADYATSLEFYYRAASEEIAEDAKRRWQYETGFLRKATA